jgi:DNA-binding transcriptional LysR family regulator
MDGRELAAIDLNLLVLFDALMTERSVTEAGRRLGKTQPTVSHGLGRLRAQFQDPLLVRTPQGLGPTPKAEALHQEVREVLMRLRQVLQGQVAFDPATAQRTFTVTMTDYAQYVLLPPLLRRLLREAPGVDLAVHVSGDEPERILAEGDADLSVGAMFDARPGLRERKLFTERFACLVRKDHPEVGEELSLETYVKLPHVLIAPRGRPGSFVDTALGKLGLSRRVALKVPHYLVAPHVVAETDMVLTLPERLARSFAGRLDVRILPPPVEVSGFAIRMAWHDRRQGDPGNAWLRGLLLELGKSL